MNHAVALQPELRALMMFDRLPEGCIAHMVTDSYSMPHIKPGEFVVVDTNDREVRHLDTYLIQWQGGRRNVCEAVSHDSSWEDKSIPRRGWNVRSISGLRGKAILDAIDRAKAHADRTGHLPALPMFCWSEGPYRSDDGYLESKIVGAVIGIYQPSFEGPLREVGS